MSWAAYADKCEMTEEVDQAPQAGEATDAPLNTEEQGESILGLQLDIDITGYLPDWLLPIWEYLQHHHGLVLLLLAVFGYLVGKGVQVLMRRGLDELFDVTQPDFDEQLIKYGTAPLLQIVMTVFIIFGIMVLDLPDELEKSVIRILVTVLILFWARAWFRATHFFLQALSRHETHGKVFHVRAIPLYRMGTKLLLLGGFVWLFMAVWGINATAWLASAGIIGIVVGFAARDSLANLISGVSIVADAPYKIGDYIVLDSGERGIVMNLGLRSTRLLTRDDVEVSIPNAVIGNAKIINESGGPWVKHRIRIPVDVAYSSDMDRVVEVLKEIAGENELMSENPAPRVRLRGFQDNSIRMDFMGWIDRPEDRGRTIHKLLMEIIRRFREEGIEIPFPQRDLHIRDGLHREEDSASGGEVSQGQSAPQPSSPRRPENGES
jgi:small-conductance mechanosensitive channel